MHWKIVLFTTHTISRSRTGPSIVEYHGTARSPIGCHILRYMLFQYIKSSGAQQNERWHCTRMKLRARWNVHVERCLYSKSWRKHFMPPSVMVWWLKTLAMNLSSRPRAILDSVKYVMSKVGPQNCIKSKNCVQGSRTTFMCQHYIQFHFYGNISMLFFEFFKLVCVLILHLSRTLIDRKYISFLGFVWIFNVVRNLNVLYHLNSQPNMITDQKHC